MRAEYNVKMKDRERAIWLVLSKRWFACNVINVDKCFHGKKLPGTTQLFNLAESCIMNQQLEAKTRHIPAENKVWNIKSKDD